MTIQERKRVQFSIWEIFDISDFLAKDEESLIKIEITQNRGNSRPNTRCYVFCRPIEKVKGMEISIFSFLFADALSRRDSMRVRARDFLSFPFIFLSSIR